MGDNQEVDANYEDHVNVLCWIARLVGRRRASMSEGIGPTGIGGEGDSV